MNQLANKKVFVGKFSREIQEKAFRLGCKWLKDNSQNIIDLKEPFLFFDEFGYMKVDYDLRYFYNLVQTMKK